MPAFCPFEYVFVLLSIWARVCEYLFLRFNFMSSLSFNFVWGGVDLQMKTRITAVTLYFAICHDENNLMCLYN